MEEEYGILHDYVLDDLSVDYNSAKEFHEYLLLIKKGLDSGKLDSDKVQTFKTLGEAIEDISS